MRFHLRKAALAVGASCLIVSGSMASAHAGSIAQDDSYEVSAGTTNPYIRVLDNDDTSVALEVVGRTDPAHGTVQLGSDNIFSYTPEQGYSGPDSFTYTVATPAGTEDTATVSIKVLPYAVTDSMYVEADQTSTLDVLANDLGVGLSIASIDTEPRAGTAAIADGMIIYTPYPGFTGTDYVTYQLQGPDGNYLDSHYGVVWISVVSDLVVSDYVDFFHAGSDVWVTNRIVGIPPFTVSNISNPAHGTAVLSGGEESVTFTPEEGFRVAYTPENGFVGVDTFTYELVDARGQTATGTVAVIVSPFLVQQDEFTVVTGTTTAFDVLANDLDAGQVPGLVLSGVDHETAHGTAVVQNGKVVYTPSSGYVGDDTFVYAVTYRGYEFDALVTVHVVKASLPTGGTAVRGAGSFVPALLVLGFAMAAASAGLKLALKR